MKIKVTEEQLVELKESLSKIREDDTSPINEINEYGLIAAIISVTKALKKEKTKPNPDQGNIAGLESKLKQLKAKQAKANQGKTGPKDTEAKDKPGPVAQKKVELKKAPDPAVKGMGAVTEDQEFTDSPEERQNYLENTDEVTNILFFEIHKIIEMSYELEKNLMGDTENYDKVKKTQKYLLAGMRTLAEILESRGGKVDPEKKLTTLKPLDIRTNPFSKNQ